jgi:hypothetical protein
VVVRLRSFTLWITAAMALGALSAAGARAERVEWSSPVSFETPAGAVSCPATAQAPDWAEVLTTITARRLTAEVLGVGALHCTVPTYGEVEIAAAGFPWHFTASAKTRRGHLRGTRKLILEVTLPSLGAGCVYEAAKVTGSLSSESPPVLSYSAPRVKLNATRSFFLCPAAGSFSGSLPLP